MHREERRVEKKVSRWLEGGGRGSTMTTLQQGPRAATYRTILKRADGSGSVSGAALRLLPSNAAAWTCRRNASSRGWPPPSFVTVARRRPLNRGCSDYDEDRRYGRTDGASTPSVRSPGPMQRHDSVCTANPTAAVAVSPLPSTTTGMCELCAAADGRPRGARRWRW